MSFVMYTMFFAAALVSTMLVIGMTLAMNRAAIARAFRMELLPELQPASPAPRIMRMRRVAPRRVAPTWRAAA